MPTNARSRLRPPARSMHTACTCGSLRKASRRISQFYDAALAPVGIKTTQYSILAELDRRGRGREISMCELAEALVMDRSTLGHSLRPLQRDDLLILRDSVDDKRKRHVELTGRGRTVLRRAQRLWHGAEGQFEAIFGRRHAAELRRALLRIAGNEQLASAAID